MGGGGAGTSDVRTSRIEGFAREEMTENVRGGRVRSAYRVEYEGGSAWGGERTRGKQRESGEVRRGTTARARTNLVRFVPCRGQHRRHHRVVEVGAAAAADPRVGLVDVVWQPPCQECGAAG